MKNKTISKLGIATFLIVVFYIFMVVFEGRVNFSKDSLQFDVEWSNLNRVILSKNSTDLELAKSETGKWVLPQKNNFPASEVMMRALFLKLMDISTSEKIQVSPSGIEKLGLNESGKASGHGVITLHYPNKEAGKIFLGALRSRKGETMQNEIALTGEYVRFSLSDQVFILPMAINLQTEAKDWLSKDILNTKLEEIYEFASYQYDATTKKFVESYSAVREDSLFLKDEVKFVLKNPTTEVGNIMPSSINNVARSLENLSLTDVEPSSNEEFQNISLAGKSVFKLMNGEIIEVKFFRIDKRHLINVSTRFDEELANEISAKYQSFKTENKDLSNVRELPVITDSEVQTKNAEFTKWTYEINENVYLGISKTIKDLVAKPEAATSSHSATEEKPDNG